MKLRSFLFSVLGVFSLDSLAANPKLTLEALTGPVLLSGPSLRGLRLSPDGKRATFLKGKPDNQFIMDLWEVDVGTKASRLLVDSKTLLPGEEILSEEEKARRERQRTGSLSGIIEYQWSQDSRYLLFPLGGELYLYDLQKPVSEAVTKLTNKEGFATDPKISPKSKYVSFVREKNLWIIDIATRKQIQLTRDASNTIANGMAEFIADEEMDRHTGYWWSPDDSAIAFTQYDESKVPLVKRMEIYADRTEVIEQRYPAAGETNVAIKLGVISLENKNTQWIDLGSNQDIYLARVDWINGNELSFQRQSRDQKTLDLVAVDLNKKSQRTLLTEKSDSWVELHYDLRFLKNGHFIWSSERSGHKHLYLYDRDGKLLNQLTDGNFEVGAVLGLNQDKQIVYFSSNELSTLENHAYSLPLAEQKWQRITQEPGVHAVTFSQNTLTFIDNWSNLTTLPQSDLRLADGSFVAKLIQNEMTPNHPYAPYFKSHLQAEFGKIESSSGEVLHYRMIKPSGFNPKKKYPVVVNVYGGPGPQMVRNSWSIGYAQFLAQNGYIAFSLDNRGSGNRSKAFKTALYRKMGTVEVEDQVAGVKFLNSLPFVDSHRIGVWGWSYGGYMTLMLLAKHSDLYACGAAGAPVTDWRLYDTHYTERFMSTPLDNTEGYKNGSVLTQIDGLKSPLLLIHGMADDNVLFSHSTQLMSLLQKKGTLFELMTYPGAKHGVIGSPSEGFHVYSTIHNFLSRCLRK